VLSGFAAAFGYRSGSRFRFAVAVDSSQVEPNDHRADGEAPARIEASIAGPGQAMMALGAWAGTTPIDALVLCVYVSCDALLGHQLVKGTTYAKDL
jgi:hypothetical protein